MITKEKKSKDESECESKVRKGKITLPIKKSATIFLSISVTFYLAFNALSVFLNKDIWFHVISILLRDIAGLFTSSIIIGVCLNYTDVSNAAEESVKKSIEEWDKKASNVIEEINKQIKETYRNFDYVTNSSKYPLNAINNKDLVVFIKRIIKQMHENNKLNPNIFTDRCFIEMTDYYFDKYERLNNGHLFNYHKRVVLLTPDSYKKSILVKTVIEVSEKPLGDHPIYTYIPKFNSKAEADSMKLIYYVINGINDEMENSGSTMENKAYYVEYQIPLIPNSLNLLKIESEYQYHLDNSYSFNEAYFLPDPSCEFSFKCSVIGEEKDNWDINISNYGYKNRNNGDRAIVSTSGSNENSLTVSSCLDVWVSEGTTCLNVNRKDKNV